MNDLREAMTIIPNTLRQTLPKDLLAGLVVFLVALPLCLGIAQASGAPLISGIISGILGGIVVGWISKSNTSVSGPAAGLTAVVAVQITQLGSFEAFLTAVVLAGVFQILLGVFRAGIISAFFPLSVIKGLLAAIGIIIILKQLPHLVGYDVDPMGEKSFFQQDGENTFTALWNGFAAMQHGALIIGLLSLVILIAWDKVKVLKHSGACIIASVKARSTSNPALWPMERSGIGQSAGRRPLPRPGSGLVGARPRLDNGGVKI